MKALRALWECLRVDEQTSYGELNRKLVCGLVAGVGNQHDISPTTHTDFRNTLHAAYNNLIWKYVIHLLTH